MMWSFKKLRRELDILINGREFIELIERYEETNKKSLELLDKAQKILNVDTNRFIKPVTPDEYAKLFNWTKDFR